MYGLLVPKLSLLTVWTQEPKHLLQSLSRHLTSPALQRDETNYRLRAVNILLYFIIVLVEYVLLVFVFFYSYSYSYHLLFSVYCSYTPVNFKSFYNVVNFNRCGAIWLCIFPTSLEWSHHWRGFGWSVLLPYRRGPFITLLPTTRSHRNPLR